MRSVQDTEQKQVIALRKIFGKDLKEATIELENFLKSLNVKLNYEVYGISEKDFLNIVKYAFEGERGKNFSGKKENILQNLCK